MPRPAPSTPAGSRPIKVRDLRHVGLRSPEVAAQAGFYVGTWGLRPAGEDRHAHYFRGSSSGRPILSLHPADRRGLHHLGFGLDDREAVAAAAAELERRGVPIVAPPHELERPGGGYGLRLLDPENRCIELSADMAAHPDDGPAGGAGPRRLCHVVLNTAGFDRIVAFYTDVLGFRVSDRIEDRMAFLRCDRKHHVLAFSRADHASVNHVAYVMADVDGVMTGLARLRARGHEPGWGPGRHGPGDNIFCYFEDPAGYVCEYTSDMETVAGEAAHEPTVWQRAPEVADRWGAAGPPSAAIRKAMAGEPDPGWAAPPPGVRRS